MMTEANQNEAPAESGAGEGQPASDEIKLSRQEYDDFQKIKVEHGTFKRDLKDAQKALEEAKKPPTTPDKNQPDSTGLLKKAFLRSAGLKPNEIDFALETAEKWNMDVDKLVDDDDWNMKLDKFRVKEANALAIAGVKGGGGDGSQAKNSTEYWKAKGAPPTPDDVPDKKLRRKIVREMMDGASKKGIQFYNE